MKIKFLGAHNTQTRDIRPAGLVIDGILALDAGGLASGLTLEEQLALKAVLITHQHYDHIKDLPLLGMNHLLNRSSFDVYCLPETGDIISRYLMDGTLYSRFLEKGQREKAVIELNTIEPDKVRQIEGYSVTPITVPHGVPAVGYLVSAASGQSFFYTGDSGPGLANKLKDYSFDLLITEVTASDEYIETCRKRGHLCPSLLREELITYTKLRSSIPKVMTVHMNIFQEEQIRNELKKVSEELGVLIEPACEDMIAEI
ncbi:MAG: MBL fold metallo-hydrolase [Dehalococcoidales bacterium]